MWSFIWAPLIDIHPLGLHSMNRISLNSLFTFFITFILSKPLYSSQLWRKRGTKRASWRYKHNACKLHINQLEYKSYQKKLFTFNNQIMLFFSCKLLYAPFICFIEAKHYLTTRHWSKMIFIIDKHLYPFVFSQILCCINFLWFVDGLEESLLELL